MDYKQTEIPEPKARKNKVIPSATPEQVLRQIDIKKKKWTPLPKYITETETLEDGSTVEKKYKVRKATVHGLVSLSEMFFPQHTEELKEAEKLCEDPLGRRPMEVGEHRWYAIQAKTKGTIVLPVRYLYNRNLSNGFGWAIAEHRGDHLTVRLATREEVEKKRTEGSIRED